MYLNKILPLIFSPIVVVLGLIVAALIFRKRFLAAAAALVLGLASLPVVADRLVLLVQGDLVRLEASEVPRREAVIVLAG
ncbi:MAG: YdcF family protein, partial [Gammaproteobacteria bacterium]|nr:YdcF family protein [Gammaproteobacteria bacterium]